MLESLASEARKRLQRAYAPKSKGTLQSAIRKLAAFARHIPSSRREMFLLSKVALRPRERLPLGWGWGSGFLGRPL